MPAAKKTPAGAAAHLAEEMDARARYEAALVAGKTEDEAKEIAWGVESALGRIESADADNTMISPAGDRFFPDSLDDALIFAHEHGATPENPERFPFEWVEQQALLPPPFDPAHCPTPTVCFPYGLGPDTSHAACIHGETHA